MGEIVATLGGQSVTVQELYDILKDEGFLGRDKIVDGDLPQSAIGMYKGEMILLRVSFKEYSKIMRRFREQYMGDIWRSLFD